MAGLQLHPAVNWTKTPVGHLQLRLPTGNHITVDENVSEAARVLSDLRSKDRICEANAAEPDAFEAEFIDILMRLNASSPQHGHPNISTLTYPYTSLCILIHRSHLS